MNPGAADPQRERRGRRASALGVAPVKMDSPHQPLKREPLRCLVVSDACAHDAQPRRRFCFQVEIASVDPR